MMFWILKMRRGRIRTRMPIRKPIQANIGTLTTEGTLWNSTNLPHLEENRHFLLTRNASTPPPAAFWKMDMLTTMNPSSLTAQKEKDRVRLLALRRKRPTVRREIKSKTAKGLIELKKMKMKTIRRKMWWYTMKPKSRLKPSNMTRTKIKTRTRVTNH